MSVALVVLHVVVCLFLVAVVLLQRGKGAEIGAVFGGGASGTVFGSRGAGNFLTKLTAVAATVFMLTSLTLSYFWSGSADEELFQEQAVQEQAADEFQDLGTVEPESAAGDFVEVEPAPAEGGEAAGDEAPPAAP